MSRESERKREMIVGIFVLGALAAVTAMIVALGSQQNIFERRFRVRAVFQNVSGLRAGAPVFVAGVTVGSVDALRFVSAAALATPTPIPEPASTPTGGEAEESEKASQVGKVEVVMTVEERFRNQIRADSVATIGSVGLLGDKCIEISVGTAAEPVIASNEVLRSTDPLTLTDVIDQIAPIRDKLDRILGDIATMTGTLTTEDAPLEKSVRSVSNILEKIDQGKGTLGQLVNSPEIGENIDSALRNLDSFVAQARGAAAKIEQATVDLPPTMAAARKVADDVARLSAKLDRSAEQLPSIMADFREVARNLRLASESLPILAADTQTGVREATAVFDAAGKTIFLRGYMDDSVEKMPIAVERAGSWSGRAAPVGTRSGPAAEGAGASADAR